MHTSIPGAVGTLFALDMAVKQYIEENVSEKEEKNFCGTKVLIRKVYNKGFAFNSMDSEPDKVKKASVITTAVILMLTLAESFRAKVLCQFLRRFFWGKVVELGGQVDHIPICTAAKAVEPLVYLHAGVLIIVKGTAGHTISFDLDPIKLCCFSGADRLLDCFKYILCHVTLTVGLSHRGLVSGSFRTLTGSFAAFCAVWLPD